MEFGAEDAYEQEGLDFHAVLHGVPVRSSRALALGASPAGTGRISHRNPEKTIPCCYRSRAFYSLGSTCDLLGLIRALGGMLLT